MPAIGLLLKNVLFSWIAKIASKQFIEWLLLWGAEELVKSTETKHDDKFFEEFKKLLEESK